MQAIGAVLLIALGAATATGVWTIGRYAIAKLGALITLMLAA